MTGYDAYRAGTGTPLVLLHGALVSWRAWRPILPLLEPFHEVFAPTLPGHRGGMSIPADQAGVTGFADLLEQYLDESGLPDAHLAGNSFGAAVALELARRGRARSAVAIAPAFGSCTTAKFDRLVRHIRRGRRAALNPAVQRVLRRPAIRRRLLRAGMEHADRIPAAELADMIQDLLGCTIADAILDCARRDGSMAPFQPSCPIRIAWPQHDRTIPYRDYGAGFVELIPGAEIIMLPGVGHAPMYDDPTLVARSIMHVTSPGTRAGNGSSPPPRTAG